MHSFRDNAIIIGRKSFGEADLMVTLLTAQHGKLRVLAKSARRPTSRLVGHTELFSVLNGHINQRARIPILSQVTVMATIDGLAEDRQAHERIALLAEVVDKALEEEVAVEAIYDLLFEGIQRLRQPYQPMLFVGLMVRLLGLLGYAPEVHHCVVCKGRLNADDAYGWDHASGGVVTNDCQAKLKAPTIHPDSVKALRFLQQQPIARMGRLQTSPQLAQELDRLLIHYARYVLEQPIVSARFSYSQTESN